MKQNKFYWARYKRKSLIYTNFECLENANDWFIVQKCKGISFEFYYASCMNNHYLEDDIEISDFAIERPYNDDELYYLHEQEEELKKLFNIQD